MASDPVELHQSAMAKLAEFEELGYPVQIRKGACYRVSRETGQLVWVAVALAQK